MTDTPRDAATVILIRDAPGGREVFLVERNKRSGFLGGAVVFPGGKVDAQDRDPIWRTLATEPRDSDTEPREVLRPFCVAGCRESLEEAAILPVSGGALDDAEVKALRARLVHREEQLAAFLASRGLALDLGALELLARWVTPVVEGQIEGRRYDTRFFVALAPAGQRGAHDAHETMASFWARPADVLARFTSGQIQLAPPTHRTLEVLGSIPEDGDPLALARSACHEPICPEVVAGAASLALVLPGDPAHSVREPRVPGASRYVLTGDRWLPAEPTPVSTPRG